MSRNKKRRAPSLATTSGPSGQTALELIHRRADEKIAELERKKVELQQRIASAQQELIAIPQAREARSQRLGMIQPDAAGMEAELQRAMSFATLSHETDREAGAVLTVTDLQKKHAEARKLFEETEREIRQADAIAAKREEELMASLAQWRLELEATRRDLLAADQAREQALQELGQSKLAEYKQILKLKYKDPLKMLRKQQNAVQADLKVFLEKAQETFFEGDWYDCFNLLFAESEANDEDEEE